MEKRKTAKAKKNVCDVCGSDCKCSSSCGKNFDCSSSGVYCLGMIGAVIYYIATATSFWGGVWGVIKGFLWPAFFTYEIFQFLGM
jgi:hypothetical protein